jgi:hypothetical protein
VKNLILKLAQWLTSSGNHTLAAQVANAESVFEQKCDFCGQRAILTVRGQYVCAGHKRILEKIR